MLIDLNSRPRKFQTAGEIILDIDLMSQDYGFRLLY